MTSFALLPKDVIYHILQYTDVFRLEKGKPIGIISKEDERYNLLEKRRHKPIYKNIGLNMYSVLVLVTVNSRKFFEISVEPTNEEGTEYIWKLKTHSYLIFPVNPLSSHYEYRIL